MAIDPSISLQVKPPDIPNPLATVGQALSLRNMMQQGKINETELQTRTLQNQQLQEHMEDFKAISEAVQQNTTLGPDGAPTIDDQGVMRSLAQKGRGKLVMEYRTNLAKLDQEGLKRTQEQLRVNGMKAERRAKLAGSVDITNPEAFQSTLLGALKQGLQEQLIDPKEAKEIIAQAGNGPEAVKPMLEQWVRMNMDAAAVTKYLNDIAENEHRKKMRPLEERKITAEAQTAEQKAAGKEPPGPPTGDLREFREVFLPGYMEQNQITKPTASQERAAWFEFQKSKRVPVPGVDVPYPPAVAEQRKQLNAQRAQIAGLSPVQFTKVQNLASQFDAHPVVKDFNVTTNQYQTVKKILGSQLGGPGDLAIVYQFMKALDPTSVVRESEYDSASKSGNIFAGIYTKFNGYLKPEGGFLPQGVKEAFANILDKKVSTSKEQVSNLYKDYARRIDKITGQGDGREYLTNPTEMLSDQKPAEPTVDPAVKAYADAYFGGDVAKAQAAIKAQNEQRK